MSKKDSSSRSEIELLDEPETAGYAGMLDDDEDIYELSMDDIVYDEEEEELEPVAAAAVGVSAPTRHDPLSTLTLAELYEQQGFVSKALDIYRTVLAEDPDNAQLLAKISQLEGQASAAENLPEQLEAPEAADEPEPFASAAFEEMSSPVEARDFSPLVHKQADNVTGTLENWLENIRRIKACR